MDSQVSSLAFNVKLGTAAMQGPPRELSSRPKSHVPQASTARTRRFYPQQLIGSGGYARVWKGNDRSEPNQVVAIKILRQPATASSLKAFIHEARILKRINHPYIVRYIGSEVCVTRHAKQIQLGLELLPFGTLWDLFESRPACRREATAILSQMSAALPYIHGKGVSHCDVKPDNILVKQLPDRDGDGLCMKLADFGLARPSQVVARTVAVNEPHLFIAPEMFNSRLFDNVEERLGMPKEQLDLRAADIWALGASVMWCTQILPMGQYMAMEEGYDLRGTCESFQDFIETCVERASNCETAELGGMVRLMAGERRMPRF